MNSHDQVTALNTRVKLRLAPSKVHGIGVFALRDISKGEHLYADHMPVIYTVPYSYFGKLFKEVRELLLERWPLIVRGSAFGYPDACMVAYMNHSDDPNYDAKTDIALKNIKAGEEVFEDYKKIESWDTVFPWLK